MTQLPSQTTKPVASELARAGLRSGPKPGHPIPTDRAHWLISRRLRRRTRASSLATGAGLGLEICGVTTHRSKVGVSLLAINDDAAPQPNHKTCGERACSRWVAQRPQTRQPHSHRPSAAADLTTASPPNASKLARHRAGLGLEICGVTTHRSKAGVSLLAINDDAAPQPNHETCGERACSRWAAQRPQTRQPQSHRPSAVADLTTASPPNASKLARHRGVGWLMAGQGAEV